MQVDEARRDQTPIGIKRAFRRADFGTNSNNRVAINRYIGSSRFGPRTIDNQSPTDHHIMHVATVPLSRHP